MFRGRMRCGRWVLLKVWKCACDTRRFIPCIDTWMRAEVERGEVPTFWTEK